MFKSETRHVRVTRVLGLGRDLESFISGRLIAEPHIFPFLKDISLSLLLLAQFFYLLQGNLDLVAEAVVHQLIVSLLFYRDFFFRLAS